MNLLELRTEALNHGFDSIAFSSRMNQYLNDGYKRIARRVDYYVDEATQAYTTVSGTADIVLPTDWARIRSLLDTDIERELSEVGLRDIDRATVTQGRPSDYAQNGSSLRLWPTPDDIYDLQLRYWKMPADLLDDADVPNLPVDWHRLIWYWAVKEAYAAEDDAQTAGYWEQQFETTLREFAADQRFPSTDAPNQARSMWGDDPGVGSGGWRRFPEGF